MWIALRIDFCSLILGKVQTSVGFFETHFLRLENKEMGQQRVSGIHPKSEKIGGDYLSAQKYWRKKCVNLGDKILQQKCVNHPNVMNFVTK